MPTLKRLLIFSCLAACTQDVPADGIAVQPEPDPSEPDPSEPDPDPSDPDPAEPENPLDEFLPDGALILDGVTPSGLNPRVANLHFALQGAEFAKTPGDVTVRVNGIPLAPEAIAVSASSLRAAAILDDGKNEISLATYDTIGRPLYVTATLWSGNAPLEVRLIDANGDPFVAPADVTLSLSDDPAITESRTASYGTASFANVPGRTVVIAARTADNLVGVIGGVGTDGVLTIQMLGFESPSAIANNELARGLEGWTIGPSATLVPHVEWVGAKLAANNDLSVATLDVGPQSISRTFTTRPGTTSVSVRYRFITSEVRGGSFGSAYNDYFSVSLRSQRSGTLEREHNTLNGLGLAAFDREGATAWRTVTLATNPKGDVIQLDAVVANVLDGKLDSAIVIDHIAEEHLRVQPKLAWNSQQGGLDLGYTIEGAPLESAVTIEVFWAAGKSYGSRIGAPLFAYTIPAGASGSGGPIRIEGASLADDPAGVTRILAASAETKVVSVADVSIKFGPHANAAVMLAKPAMTDTIIDSLRAAGEPTGTITSTVRTPHQQAHAMFTNLVNPEHPIATNIAKQLELYTTPGDAVIGVFVELTRGLEPAQIAAARTQIIAEMLAEIIAQGPAGLPGRRVSRHCGDPALRLVLDVGASVFSASNLPLFVGAAGPRVTKLIAEPTNKALHLEE